MRFVATSDKARGKMIADTVKARRKGRKARRHAPKRTIAALAGLGGIAAVVQAAKTLRKEPKSDVYPPKGYSQQTGS